MRAISVCRRLKPAGRPEQRQQSNSHEPIGETRIHREGAEGIDFVVGRGKAWGMGENREYSEQLKLVLAREQWAE